jgi:hypothetical protein
MRTLLALLAPTTAFAWPTDSQWVPLPDAAGVLQDDLGDHTTGDGSMDIVGDAVTAAAWWYADGTDVFLRMQVDDDPMSIGLFKPQAWAWLVDTDGDSAFDFALAVEGGTAALSAYSMDGTTGIQPGFSAYTLVGAWGDAANGDVRSVLGPTTTWFVDIQVSRADLSATLGVGDPASASSSTGRTCRSARACAPTSRLPPPTPCTSTRTPTAGPTPARARPEPTRWTPTRTTMGCSTAPSATGTPMGTARSTRWTATATPTASSTAPSPE